MRPARPAPRPEQAEPERAGRPALVASRADTPGPGRRQAAVSPAPPQAGRRAARWKGPALGTEPAPDREPEAAQPGQRAGAARTPEAVARVAPQPEWGPAAVPDAVARGSRRLGEERRRRPQPHGGPRTPRRTPSSEPALRPR